MANEITYSFALRLSNGDLNDQYSSSSLRADQTTPRLIRNVQDVGFAAAEALETGDIVTPGMAVFVNLEPTGGNFIEIGSWVAAAFYPFLRVNPGEQQICRIGVAAAILYAKADITAVELFYIIYDD